MINSFCHQMINSLIQCHRCHSHEKHNFLHSCLTDVSVHGRPLSTQVHVSQTHFLGHVHNINSRTSSKAGFSSECTGMYWNTFCTGKCTEKVLFFLGLLENVLEFLFEKCSIFTWYLNLVCLFWIDYFDLFTLQ